MAVPHKMPAMIRDFAALHVDKICLKQGGISRVNALEDFLNLPDLVALVVT
jgi:hypothetical protein